MMTDPIADMLTRVRNATMAGHRKVDIPSSRVKREIARIMKERGFIHKVPQDDSAPDLTLLGWPVRMSKSKVPITSAPRLGDHTDTVLETELGMSREAVRELIDDGIIR